MDFVVLQSTAGQGQADSSQPVSGRSISSAYLEKLLKRVFAGHSKRHPIAANDLAGRCQIILQNRRWTNTIITAGEVDGDPNHSNQVQWNVHLDFLVASSQVPRDKACAIPEGTTPQITIFLPFRPMVVDRFVHYLYTGTYKLDGNGQAVKLHCATKVPDGHDIEFCALKDTSYLKFHMMMYQMGEKLNAEGLTHIVQGKMVEYITTKLQCNPKHLAEMVALTYVENFCIDKEGMLKGLLVAAVLAHERLVWSQGQIKSFTWMVKDHTAFMVDWKNGSELRVKVTSEESRLGKVVNKKRKVGNKVDGDN